MIIQYTCYLEVIESYNRTDKTGSSIHTFFCTGQNCKGWVSPIGPKSLDPNPMVLNSHGTKVPWSQIPMSQSHMVPNSHRAKVSQPHSSKVPNSQSPIVPKAQSPMDPIFQICHNSFKFSQTIAHSHQNYSITFTFTPELTKLQFAGTVHAIKLT